MKMRITVNQTAYEVEVEILDHAVTSTPPAPASPVASSPPKPTPAAPPAAARAAGAPASGDVTSPIAGNVLDVKVKAGDRVAMNDPLLVLEAMKMESNVAAPRAGTVSEVLVKSGDAVTAGQVLVKLT